ASVYAAICRARGLPARVRLGLCRGRAVPADDASAHHRPSLAHDDPGGAHSTHPRARRHLVRDARRRRALRQDGELKQKGRQEVKRRGFAWLAAIAAAASFVVTGAAWAQGKYVHANNSGYDNLDPHVVFDVGRAASRINFYDGLLRWVDNPPKQIP